MTYWCILLLRSKLIKIGTVPIVFIDGLFTYVPTNKCINSYQNYHYIGISIFDSRCI